MAQPTTARFGKMRVMLGTPSGPNPPAYPILSISKANPAVVTLQTGISSFSDGQLVYISGITDPDYKFINGVREIGNVATSPTQTFELVGIDTSGAAAAKGPGGTADAPTPMTWAAPCGFTSKSLVMTKNLQEINLPDCEDPDAVAWIGRDAQSLTSQITGEGVAAAESVPTWNDAWTNVDSVAARVEIEFSTGTKVFQGYYQVETLTFGAEQGGRVTLNVSMQSDGILVDQWTPNP